MNNFCNLIVRKLLNKINPYKIAKDENIIIIEESLGEVAGYYNAIYDDSKIIHLNSDNSQDIINATLLYFLQYNKIENTNKFKIITNEHIQKIYIECLRVVESIEHFISPKRISLGSS